MPRILLCRFQFFRSVSENSNGRILSPLVNFPVPWMRPWPPPASSNHELTLATAERKNVLYVYNYAGRNKCRTAQLPGMSRSTLDRKLKAAEDATAAP